MTYFEWITDKNNLYILEFMKITEKYQKIEKFYLCI